MITILLILLSFIGQSVAFAYGSCLKESQNPSADMVMMDHSIHMNMDEASMTKIIPDDCCDTGCDCPMASCLSVVLPAAAQFVGEYPVSTQNFWHLQSLVTSQFPDSLYRPPISR